MISKSLLSILTVLGFSLAVNAQEKDAAAPVQIRAVLHDPVNPICNLFYTDKAGAVVQLNFRPVALSLPFFMIPVNGSLVFYDKAAIDPKNPAASLAGSVKLPSGMKQAIAVVLPSPTGTKPPYQILLIDDSPKAFPKGESRVIPLINLETAIQAGEHRLPVHPGQTTKVPPVKKVNEYNMAQTNFYYKKGDLWIPFTERQLQFFDLYRRLFIVHATPGALQPTITTIVDTTPIP